ncbi:MAG: hypothetical protein ACRENO_01630, partial [Thermodesulfobacteriota bacterium]
IKIVEKEWTTKKEIKRFKHTANSPSVLGEDARHGEENTQPPLKPMTLLEARQFIEKLIHNWISTKS